MLITFGSLIVASYAASFLLYVGSWQPLQAELWLAGAQRPDEMGETGATYFLVGLRLIFSCTGVILAFPWLANVLLWVGLFEFMRNRFRTARNLGIFAVFLASMFLAVMLRDIQKGYVPGVGYWLWGASMAELTWAGFWLDRIFPNVAPCRAQKNEIPTSQNDQRSCSGMEPATSPSRPADLDLPDFGQHEHVRPQSGE